MTDQATQDQSKTAAKVQTRNVPLTEEELQEYQNHRDAGTFSEDSLTTGDEPYKRLPMRREVPPGMKKKAGLAASFLLLEGHGTSERVVICQSTPQWAADIINRAADEDGIVDSWRQKFAYESLKMIRAGSPPSVATTDSLDKLRNWENASPGKRKYVEVAREMLESPSERQLLKTGQRLERFEIYFQVWSQLEEDGYDGSMYDLQRIRKRKSAQEN
jgi:hypothetical protein